MDLTGSLEDDFEQSSDEMMMCIDTPTEECCSDSLEFKDKFPDHKFQSNIIFNRLLPYADKLDDEADALFAKIKANFGRSVMLRKIKPDFIIWANMLDKYMTLYNLRFTKEDHICLIKLIYELIAIPNLETPLVISLIHPLMTLLRKTDLIAPSELELPWRPLYNLYKYVIPTKSYQITFYHHPERLKSMMESLICVAKFYFPVSATQEILDELRPQIYPLHNVIMKRTMKELLLFLPIELAPKYHPIGHNLWFNEFMNLWELCSPNDYSWGNYMLDIMSRLAYYNIGYIDWEPYMSLMFTRFVQSFNLPVCYKKTKSFSYTKMGPFYIALWIGSNLGNNSSAQNYLDKFLKTVETYFHPANYGSWLRRLTDFFVDITAMVVKRLYLERYITKPMNRNPIPDSHKLTDADVDAFVNSMMPIAMIAIFNKRCSQICYDALHNLALMRPNIVIPKVLEKVYPNLGSDIEPHKLITAMVTMITISRPLVQGSRVPNKDYAFPEGPLHVLPLLFASLSGIDPNDPNKTFAAFRLIGTYITMVPVVDCSKSTADMTDDERLVCEETSRFEDFVLQFMDKVFTYIDSIAVVSVRLENNNASETVKSRTEAMAENALMRVFKILLPQSSKPIFMGALGKLRAFIVANILETGVAGQLVAILCTIFSQVNSRETLKALLPFLAEKVLDAIGEGDDVLNAETLDTQLLYPLLLLNKLLFTQGDALLPYMNTLVKVLDRVLLLKSREGNIRGCAMLGNIMQSLAKPTTINLDRDLDDPNYPYIRDWGEPAKIKATKVKLYTPGDEEIEALQKLFRRYFVPAVESIQNFIRTKNSSYRNELQITLRVILNILNGCGSALPYWDEPPLKIKPYEECIEGFEFYAGVAGKVTMPDGTNVRYFMVQIMTELQEIMLENIGDDIKSLIILQLIWKSLLLAKGRLPPEASFKFSTNYHISKKVVENKMTGCQGWFPELILTRVYSQHHIRQMCNTVIFTESHKNILMNLLKLSTSQYSRIRATAQETMLYALSCYPNAYKIMVPHFIEILKLDPMEHHDAFKGMLYLLTTKVIDQESLLVKHDWENVQALWTALLLSKPSEKPSINRLEDRIVDLLLDTYYTANIKLEIPDRCVAAAANLWNVGAKPCAQSPSEKEIQAGIEVLRDIGNNNVRVYYETLDGFLEALLEKNLHWRHRIMALNFIYVLIHPDYKYPPQLVRFFCNLLISDTPDERKIGIRMVMCVLKQLKKKQVKKTIDVPSIGNELTSNGTNAVQPGCRLDNEWLQYKYVNQPRDAADWDKPRFIHQSYVGYYTWPSKLEIYAPASEQPGYDPNTMSEQDKEVHQFFNDRQNVDKFLEYLTAEDKTDREKFCLTQLIMFKGLFRNYGDTYLDSFLPHLRRLVADKQEISQRCAAEIISGLIKGSKHWTYEMTERMWQELLPILRTALSNMTVETITDWMVCIAHGSRDRDPNRLHWLYECLMEESPLGQSEASFIKCGRLLILQGALMVQSWRAGELLNRLVTKLESSLEESPFQNVRDRLASVLVSVFRANFKFDLRRTTNGHAFPEVSDFVDKVYPRLLPLLEEDASAQTLTAVVNKLSISEDEESSSQTLQSANVISDREKTVRLFKTICRWIFESLMISSLDSLPSIYKIYPIMCHLENNSDSDEDLSKTCTRSVAILAQTLTLPKHVPTVLEAVRNISQSSSWSARASCLEFLQVLVFHNMSILLSNEVWIRAIQDIVLRLLEDETLEVREKAAQVLGGLLHCTILPDQEALLEEFKKRARTKLGNKKKKLSSSDEKAARNAKILNAARLRHAGVLGMCAFVQAHPYDVPQHIPPIFECLSSHLNDPEPIPSTIRKTLNDFKRTHCDGWTGLQGLAEHFTEEQFEVLQDLSVPPSYYA